MSALGRVLFELVPYAMAFVVGLVVPRRRSWFERVALGVVLLLATALISTFGPDGIREVGTVSPAEWPHLLNLIVFLPIVGAVVIMFLPRQTPRLLQRFTLAVLVADFGLSLLLLRVPMTTGWHFQYVRDWLPSLGIRYHVAVDGLSLWLVLLTTLTTPLAAYVSFGSLGRRSKELAFSLLLLQGAMLGVFVALDLFLFYVFWELLLVPMFLIIGVWGGLDRIRAAYKFFLFTMTGSVLMLGAILYLVWWHQRLAGYVSFDYLALSRLSLPRFGAWLCFAGFALAFFVKVPLFPWHTWLPDAHVEAPTGGSVVLAAVLLKLGSYGYARFCMGILGGPAYMAGATLAGLAFGGGILYAALVSWKQDDLKRLVAYSSVAHMGFVMLGLFAATQVSIQGAFVQMINHGISTGALFILVGVLYDRRHTRLIQDYGGLATVMPVCAAVFLVIAMSSIGVPGTNGFVGELMVITGTFNSIVLGSHAWTQGTLAAVGVILAAVYLLSATGRVFFGPLKHAENRRLADLSVRETVALAPLVVLVFVLGFYPMPLLRSMEPAAVSLIERFHQGRRAYLEMPPDSQQALLLPRRGGPLEQGYPEGPPATDPPTDAAGSDPGARP
jgi:NADH-quinone oxidoreductase subunit M